MQSSLIERLNRRLLLVQKNDVSMKLSTSLLWFPPAETKLPLRALLGAIVPGKSDLEKALCAYLGGYHCIFGNSAKALLYSLLMTLKRSDRSGRDEVVIPGYTCYSVAASVAKANLKIRVYDMDPQTLRPDLSSLRKSASSKTLAIVFQHLFGIPTPVEGEKGIAEGIGAHLIEDAAQALGGALNGQPLGSIGDFGFYSFGRGKPLPIGCGGALIGKDADILASVNSRPRSIKGYGSFFSAALLQVVSKPLIYWIPESLPLGLGKTIFDPGFDLAAMPHLCERLAEKSLPLLDDLNAHRQKIAETYKKAFDENRLIPVPREATPVITRFPLMAGPSPLPKKLKRLGLRRMYPKAIVDEKNIKPYLADQQVSCPGASEIAQNLITLPTHKMISEDRAREIAQEVMATRQYR